MKRSLGFDVADVPSGKRLRRNMADLFLKNSVSATRAASLFSDAAAAGAEGMGDLERVGAPKHHHRNLLKKMLKGSKWPRLHFGSIRVRTRRSEQEEVASVPFLLPHEIVRAFHFEAVGDLFEQRGMDTIAAAHLATTTRHMGITARVVGLVLWIDGVVNKWDRSSSLEMVGGAVGVRSYSLVLDGARLGDEAHTFDDVLTITTWSLQQCCVGKVPECRHDGAPLGGAADAKRKRLGGTDLGCAALKRLSGSTRRRQPRHVLSDSLLWHGLEVAMPRRTPSKALRVKLQRSTRGVP